MSARAVSGRGRRRGLLAGALAAATEWLIEPTEGGAPTDALAPSASVAVAQAEPTRHRGDGQPADGAGLRESPTPPQARPVVVVIGLAPRCGATTVARALGTRLAVCDRGGACAVTAALPARAAGAVPLGLPAGLRLARTLAPLARAPARACGRLCLVDGADRPALADAARYLAPLVVDLDRDADAAAVAALADHVVLVGSPACEPALAAVLADSLGRVGPTPLTVLNRAPENCGRWAGRAAVELPESRLGAQFALAGHEPRGAFGAAIHGLAAGFGAPSGR